MICKPKCDPANEPLASALENFVKAFFGTVTKTCVDGKVVWVLPCDLEAGCANFPRNSGEGIACYLLRLYASGVVCNPPAPTPTPTPTPTPDPTPDPDPTPPCITYPVTVYKSGGHSNYNGSNPTCSDPVGCGHFEPQILLNSSSAPVTVTNQNTCNAYVSVEAVAYDATNQLVYSNHVFSGDDFILGSGASSVSLVIGPSDLQCNAPCLGGGDWCPC